MTAIDPVAVIEGAREPHRPRNRLMAWLSGTDADEPLASGSLDALAPPEPAVRREMLRLQMEAELSDLSAEAEAIATDQALEAAAAGNAAAAQADIAAARDANAATDALVESPEELQAEGEGPAEAGRGKDPTAVDDGAEPPDPAATA